MHDQTVADDYYAAMAQIEQRLQVDERTTLTPPEPRKEAIAAQLSDLCAQLEAPQLAAERRLALVGQLRNLLQDDIE